MTFHFRAAALAAATALTLLAAAAPYVPSAASLDPQPVKAERCAIHDDPFFFDTCLVSRSPAKSV